MIRDITEPEAKAKILKDLESEHSELSERLSTLNATLDSASIEVLVNKLGARQVLIMQKQRTAMGEYAGSLKLRIQELGSPRDFERSNPPEVSPRDLEITQTKSLRRRMDYLLQEVKALGEYDEVKYAATRFTEGIMWLGMNLKRLGNANPYPSSKDPSNTKIEPTADNLKL